MITASSIECSNLKTGAKFFNYSKGTGQGIRHNLMRTWRYAIILHFGLIEMNHRWTGFFEDRGFTGTSGIKSTLGMVGPTDRRPSKRQSKELRKRIGGALSATLTAINHEGLLMAKEKRGS